MIKILSAFIVAMFLALSTSSVSAQAPALTSPGDGLTSTVQGIFITQALFANASGYGMFVPYYFSNQDVAASIANGSTLLLVHTNGQSAKAFEWNLVWTFNAGEATTIRTWLEGLSLRNNLEVQFTATWNSGRFAINTATWTFVYASLMPYGILPSCNITARVIGSRMALAAVPDSCQNVLVPGQKSSAIASPECLIMHGRTAIEIDGACRTVRAFLESIYCLDGASGTDLVCNYNAAFLPNGVPGSAVVSVGADGYPTSGRNTPAPPPSNAGAGAVSSTVVAIVVAVIASMMF